MLRPFGTLLPVLTEKKVVGGGYRLNVLCPVCNATDRERLVYQFLSTKTDLFQRPQRLLHVAPERQLSRVLARHPNLDYLTADLYRSGVDIKVDMRSIGCANATFDAMICNHVLEHIPEDDLAMAEIFRVLRPGGWAILQVPISLSLERTYEDPTITTEARREEAFGQSDHVRIYAKDYRSRLERAGFRVTVFDWTEDRKNFGGPDNQFALNPDENLYVATKPSL